MNWNKELLKKLEKEGKIKSVTIPPDAKNKIKIPKEIGKYKLHIIAVLERSELPFVSELKFDEVRDFRFDWAIPELNLAIEYEGIFSDKSGHTTLSGYKKDCEKYNLATLRGWRMLRYTAANYLDIEEDIKNLKNFQFK
ncbi:hypothetical protein [Epilithonimonas caeni]|uniref:hypothetical protein n=1 Tax=Epilithonimonas caeni TaxID=365343 RepID=UPI0003F87EA0|nr:hypothetical protein [Epilithonimonas caeni]